MDSRSSWPSLLSYQDDRPEPLNLALESLESILSPAHWAKLNVHVCFSMLLIASAWDGYLAEGSFVFSR